MSYGEQLAALRAYVTGGQEPELHAPAGEVRLNITHNLLGMSHSRNFPLTISISDFKDRVRIIILSLSLSHFILLFLLISAPTAPAKCWHCTTAHEIKVRLLFEFKHFFFSPPMIVLKWHLFSFLFFFFLTHVAIYSNLK